jgi:conjugal transfer pilus assembly protein TraB
MRAYLNDRLATVFEGLSPRARQWATIGGIGVVAVGVLWVAFSMGGSDALPRSAGSGAGTATKPTNIEMMAPGAQIKDSEVWIGKAGRELDQYKAEREDQRRINRERQETQEALTRKFAELESRLRAVPVEPPVAMPAVVPQPVPAPLTVPPPPTAATTAYPPESLLPRSAGAPPLPLLLPTAPALVRITVTSPAARAGDSDESKQSPTAGAFLPVSFTRGQLLGGLDAPTGGQSQNNPHPVLIRLSDNSVLPNRFRAAYRECFVIAAGYGDISSERAYMRTESLSCVRTDGQALEVKIQGSVFGDDGKVGVRGRLVSKQGQMLANALMAGVIGGIGQGVSSANSTYSTSAFGTVSTTGGAEAMKAGLGTGVGRALDRLAQYYIKLAEQTFPIIEIDAGLEVDVVLTKGVRIDNLETANVAPTSLSDREPPAERYVEVSNDED